MSIYNTGSVRVKVGSQNVRGASTDFSTYVTVGDLFRLTSDSVYYDVAAVVNATNLTLSGRYANTNHETGRTENVASANTATRMYSFTLSNTPVIQNKVSINASIEKFTDDGAGVLTGDGTPAGSGSVDYDTGSVSITLGTDLTATVNVVASYNSGDTLNAMPYQVVTDFTSHYNLPEMGLNDTQFQYLYTKGQSTYRIGHPQLR